MRLSDLAARFGLARCGDGDPEITGVAGLAPGKAGAISFLASPKFAAHLPTTACAAVIVSPRHAANAVCPGLVAKDPYLAYARVAKLFDPRQSVVAGIHPSAVIAPTATLGAGCRIDALAHIADGAVIGDGCWIGAGVHIGADVQLGQGSRVSPKVVIEDGVRIGARALIQAGAVIGSRGFGNARTPEGQWEEVPQLGSVVIGDDVEIGANTCIDRGAIDDTVIEDGVRLDNLIQIAHNCRVGAHTAIAGGAGIAGSTTVGKRCMIGGAANLNGHITIADDVVVLGRAMVTHALTEPGMYGSGLPVAPATEWRRTVARIRRLAHLQARVKHLEALLNVSPAPDEPTSDA